ncbi:hypothetical protein FKM82_013000 [Ascaphus truei]
MTSFICTLSIFVALMSTVHCIKCKSCWNLNSTICSGNNIIDCKGSCITYSENVTIGDKSLASIRSGCEDYLSAFLKNFACTKFMSIKTQTGLKAAVTAQCCNSSDFCNENHQYNNSQIESKPDNNFYCPSCFKANTLEECVPIQNMACIENQLQCLNYIGVVQLADGSVSSYSFKGCVNMFGCLLGFAVLPGTKELKCKKMHCTPALEIPTIVPPPPV